MNSQKLQQKDYKTTLILDPAASTGYAVVRFPDTGVAEIIEYGFIEIDSETDYNGDRYIELAEKIRALIEKHKPFRVGLEDYFFSKKSSQGSNLNCAYRAIIHMVCREQDIEYDILNITLWKQMINGRVRPTKEQKAKWGKEPAKKLMTQEALWEKWNIRFPNHSLSKKTGKPIKFRYDIVDAVAMAIFHTMSFCPMGITRTLNCLVINPDDVEWKKEPKGIYKYEEK